MRVMTEPTSNYPDEAMNQGQDDQVALLAADYIQRQLSGEEANLDRYLERLDVEAERTRFRELISGAERIQGMLPRQVQEGRILSDRYRIDSELGAGGMGKVFAATDFKLKRRVAVKVLGTFDTSDLDMGELFARESELLASLQHPGIVSIHEAAREGDVQYLVMDLVEGVSVNKLLDRVRRVVGEEGEVPRSGREFRTALRLPVPDGSRDLISDESWSRTVSRVMAEVIRTIEAAHSQGVVHRDLKPGNVMVKGDGTPVVLDFGLAGKLNREASELTRRLFGSAAYVAPEQVRQGQAGADTRSDIYQLGLMLYEMLTLHQAFSGDDISKVLEDIGTGRFVRPRKINPQIPVELEAICLMAMELDSNRRYQSAQEFRTDLELFLSGLGRPRAVSGGRVTLLVRDSRYFARRHRRPVQIIAALFVGMLLALPFLTDPGPEVRGVTWSKAGEETIYNPQFVRKGDLLGVEIDSDELVYVYGYALSGPPESPHQTIVPVRPVDSDPGQWEFRFEAGSRVLPMSVASAPREGIVVFVLEEQDEPLRLWLEKLAAQAEGSLAGIEGGVTMDFARSALDSLAMIKRGGTPDGGLTPEERRRLRAAIDASKKVDGLDLPFQELDPITLFLAVRD